MSYQIVTASTPKVLEEIWLGLVFGLLMWPILKSAHCGLLAICRRVKLEPIQKMMSILPKPTLLEVLLASILGSLCGGCLSWF